MGVIDRLVYEVGYDVDKSSFDNVKKGVSDISGAFKRMASFAAMAGTAIIGFTALTTTQEAEMQRLANAMGVSGDTMDAFGNEMKKIGGTTENFLDLIEETSNKIGEMKGLGEFNTLEESLGILNLRFEDLERLSPEKQFEAITKAALAMEDQQKAVTAVDMLMSGEANKLISSLRAQGLTYDDVIRKQKILTFQTDESRQNSLKFANGLNDLMRVVSSLAKFIAGELGGVMSDMVAQFTDWAVANKEVIASGIKEFVKGLASLVSGLWTIFSALGRVISVVVGALGGLGGVIRILIAGGVVFGIIKVAQAIAFIGIAAKRSAFSMKMLNKAFRTMRNLLLIGALIAIFEDLIGWINGADSAMGRLVGSFDTWKVDAIAGLRQLGSMIVEALLMPINLVIKSVRGLVGIMNKIPGMDIGAPELIQPGDVFSGIAGQTSIADMSKQALGFNTPNSTVNNAVDIVVNATGNAADIAKEVGREIERVFESTNSSLQTVNK